MQRFYTFLGLFVALLLLGISQSAQAAVTLIDFSAEYDSDNEEVKLEWRTATEDGTAGYFIVRATNRSQLENLSEVSVPSDWPEELPFIEVEYEGSETTAIANIGSAIDGGTYVAFDAGPEDGFAAGTTYHYLLVERETDGSIIPINSPVMWIQSVFAGSATPTPTRISQTIGGGGSTATPTNTPTTRATTAPTATPTAANTATPANSVTATAQAQATGTPVPTATNTPAATATAVPAATNTPAPTATPLPSPTSTPLPSISDSDAGDDEDDATEADNAAVRDAATSVDGGGTSAENNSVFSAQSAEAAANDEAAVEAIAQVDPTPYPEGETQPAVDDSSAEDAYIAPPTEQPSAFGATESTTNSSTQNNGTIGGSTGGNVSEIGGSAQTNTAIPVQTADDGGINPLLWLVFAGGLLIFVGGVIGSILIFTRQRGR